MDLPVDAIRVRATLTKPGAPDVRLELHRMSAAEFAVIEDGSNVGVFYRGLAPPRTRAPALTYSGSHLDIADAFERCVAKHYPDYTARDIETASD